MTLPTMIPPARTFMLLIITTVMLIAAAPVSSAQGETCFSRQHQKAIVNSRLALANPGTAMDTRAVQSERDCVLACCSEELKPDAKCNMAVFNSNKPTNMDNCYLFHCDKEQDCPLMVAPEGINTYDIFKGVIHPTTVRPASTSVEPTTTTTTTQAPTSPATTTPPPPTTILIESTTTTTTVTMAPATKPTATATATPTTTKATTTRLTSTSSQFTTTAASTQAPTTTQATSIPTQPPKIATTPQALPVMVKATMPVATAPPNGKPTASATQQSAPSIAGDSRLTAAPVPTTTLPTTKKQNKTNKKTHKPTKKVKTAVATTTTTTNATATASTPPAVTPGRKTGRRTTPKPEAVTEHLTSTTPTTQTKTTTTATTTASTVTVTTTTMTTTTPTAGTTTTTTVLTATVTATTTVDAEPYITRITTVLGLVGAEGGIQRDPVHQNAVSVESIAQGSAVTRGALRSSLVALMVLGLALLTLALAAGGRKAMESFDRRHYTRLELNDLHYEV